MTNDRVVNLVIKNGVPRVDGRDAPDNDADLSMLIGRICVEMMPPSVLRDGLTVVVSPVHDGGLRSLRISMSAPDDDDEEDE